ncbi:MAG: CDP-glucose 4,6-dehydratase [Cytophagia bacterium]|nr:CDP-glucose 4,6-dehydratase [Cytophagia bacterium]
MENMELSYYRGKRVFVTGHTGFKGSWFINVLKVLGAEVKGYALDPCAGKNPYRLVVGERALDSEINDIRDADALKEAIRAFKPDFVFHMAAQPLVKASYSDPLYTYQVNVIGTANLLMALKGLDKTCSCVVITTDKVYENKEWHYPYRETDRLGGYDPYSSSKACTELVTSSLRSSFFNLENYGRDHAISIACARAGNVIGGGDYSENRVIPDFVRAIERNKPLVMRNPYAIRPWQHVLEPLFGYLELGVSLAENPVAYSEGWNFGPSDKSEKTVLEVINKIIECWGKGEYRIEADQQGHHEAGLLKLDISKTVNRLNWKPMLGFDTTLAWTSYWYIKESEGAVSMVDFSIKQIEEYLQMKKS